MRFNISSCSTDFRHSLSLEFPLALIASELQEVWGLGVVHRCRVSSICSTPASRLMRNLVIGVEYAAYIRIRSNLTTTIPWPWLGLMHAPNQQKQVNGGVWRDSNFFRWSCRDSNNYFAWPEFRRASAKRMSLRYVWLWKSACMPFCWAILITTLRYRLEPGSENCPRDSGREIDQKTRTIPRHSKLPGPLLSSIEILLLLTRGTAADDLVIGIVGSIVGTVYMEYMCALQMLRRHW